MRTPLGQWAVQENASYLHSVYHIPSGTAEIVSSFEVSFAVSLGVNAGLNALTAPTQVAPPQTQNALNTDQQMVLKPNYDNEGQIKSYDLVPKYMAGGTGLPNPQGETISFYRAMGQSEYDNLMSTGEFRAGSNSLGGKFFATTPENAAKWGDIFYPSGDFRIVQITTTKTIANSFYQYNYNLDGIGHAVYAETDQLKGVSISSYK